MGQMQRAYREREDRARDRLFDYAFVSPDAQQYARHGALRRLTTIRWCIDRLFQVLPVDADNPYSDALAEAAILLQAFIMHATGVMDNLARIWCLERGRRDPIVGAIPPMEIGLGPRYERVRNSLTDAFRDYLQQMDQWFGYLKNYRDAFAHRIPLYIPPRIFEPADEERYRDLERNQLAAWQRQDYEDADRLGIEMRRLGRFDPLMMHAFGNGPEDGRPIRLHAQMVSDHATVVEICELMLTELEAL
ncbi:hypothetical protein B5U98_29345 [Bosea sp. Tri-39]|nr:hypothetical protein BLM15_20050 [Bosea sp. Tri-49]RXT16114.1 hypothetical protein B5U98_29345 [Bosea sp. Tri-39]RXT39806.1 hypothetical protein B5U99_06390 [Bosea sp. Tri-54]